MIYTVDLSTLKIDITETSVEELNTVPNRTLKKMCLNAQVRLSLNYMSLTELDTNESIIEGFNKESFATELVRLIKKERS